MGFWQSSSLHLAIRLPSNGGRNKTTARQSLPRPQAALEGNYPPRIGPNHQAVRASSLRNIKSVGKLAGEPGQGSPPTWLGPGAFERAAGPRKPRTRDRPGLLVFGTNDPSQLWSEQRGRNHPLFLSLAQ